MTTIVTKHWTGPHVGQVTCNRTNIYIQKPREVIQWNICSLLWMLNCHIQELPLTY